MVKLLLEMGADRTAFQHERARSLVTARRVLKEKINPEIEDMLLCPRTILVDAIDRASGRLVWIEVKHGELFGTVRPQIAKRLRRDPNARMCTVSGNEFANSLRLTTQILVFVS